MRALDQLNAADCFGLATKCDYVTKTCRCGCGCWWGWC